MINLSSEVILLSLEDLYAQQYFNSLCVKLTGKVRIFLHQTAGSHMFFNIKTNSLEFFRYMHVDAPREYREYLASIGKITEEEIDFPLVPKDDSSLYMNLYCEFLSAIKGCKISFDYESLPPTHWYRNSGLFENEHAAYILENFGIKEDIFKPSKFQQDHS